MGVIAVNCHNAGQNALFAIVDKNTGVELIGQFLLVVYHQERLIF